MNAEMKKLFKTPLFDGHMHFSHAYFDQILASYDECGIMGGVNLWATAYNGGYHSDYIEFLKECKKRRLNKRFVQFCWPNWTEFGWQPQVFVKNTCKAMRRYAGLGVRGMKVWKDLGMYIQFEDGAPALIDDERLEPLWKTASELNWTISVHMADPSHNWVCRTGLTREMIFERRDRVLAAHPKLPFILCHSGNYIESVRKFGALLDRFPNVKSDLSPLEGNDNLKDIRAFLEKYADRLYLGTDLMMPEDRPPDRKWNIEEYMRPFRLRLSGYGLTKEAYDKITRKNGERDFLHA
ncbi:MAG: amidohydrolase family protein [Candidatus Firestonebacteria bacterium]